MFKGAARLAILAAVLSFGATGIAVAATGLGLSFVLGATIAAVAAGVVMYAALRAQPPPDRGPERALNARLDSYKAATGALRHDLRGVLSPALMMSDRLLAHQDPAVQRAGQAVVRSVERATTILANNRVFMAEPNGDVPVPLVQPER